MPASKSSTDLTGLQNDEVFNKVEADAIQTGIKEIQTVVNSHADDIDDHETRVVALENASLGEYMLKWNSVTQTYPAKTLANHAFSGPVQPTAIDHGWADGDVYFPTLSVSAPTGLAIDSVSGSTFNFSWTDNADNETGFQLFASIGNNSNYQLVKDDIAANATSASWNSGQGTGVAVYLKLRAKALVSNVTYYSGYSNEANATTAADFRSVVLGKSPYLYWDLDQDSGDALDQTGNGRDGIAHNNPERVAGLEVSAAGAGAFRFNIIDQFKGVYVPLTPANNTLLAVFFSFRMDNATSPDKFMCIGKSADNNDFFVFRHELAKLRIQKYITNGSTLTVQIDSTDDLFVDGVIKTCGIIIDQSSGDYTIIVDGGTPQTGNNANLASNIIPATMFSIGGQRNASWGAYGKGTMDEVVYFSTTSGSVVAQDLIDIHNSFVKAP